MKQRKKRINMLTKKCVNIILKRGGGGQNGEGLNVSEGVDMYNK